MASPSTETGCPSCFSREIETEDKVARCARCGLTLGWTDRDVDGDEFAIVKVTLLPAPADHPAKLLEHGPEALAKAALACLLASQSDPEADPAVHALRAVLAVLEARHIGSRGFPEPAEPEPEA